MEVRPLLEELERGADDVDPSAALAFLAGQELALGEDELNAARRRAVFVLASGGDPHRELHPASRAVATLASDLDAPGRQGAFASALAGLAERAVGLPAVASALAGLGADEELAWRWFALALLAEELAGDEAW